MYIYKDNYNIKGLLGDYEHVL